MNLSLNKLLSTILETYSSPIDLSSTRKKRKILVVERYRYIRKNAYIYYRKAKYFIKEYLESSKKLVENILAIIEVEEKEVEKE